MSRKNKGSSESQHPRSAFSRLAKDQQSRKGVDEVEASADAVAEITKNPDQEEKVQYEAKYATDFDKDL